jgi:cathepsin B
VRHCSTVYPDFYDYESGVYRVAADPGTGLGMHATKLIGWGVEDGDPYWIMMNSWRNWGRAFEPGSRY